MSANSSKRDKQLFGGKQMITPDEDPALLTQSSKIVYIQTETLEDLKNPEKEYKMCTSKG